MLRKVALVPRLPLGAFICANENYYLLRSACSGETAADDLMWLGLGLERACRVTIVVKAKSPNELW